MYTEEDIASAITSGVLTPETAAAFRAHVAKLKSRLPADEEYFRLVSGFHDIFVVIACLLLLTSVASIGAVLAPWLGAVGVSAVAWTLAESFTRKRRMALLAIVLALAFIGGTLVAGFLFLGKTTHATFAASALAGVSAWLHWLRFQVPITVAAGVASVGGAFVALLFLAVPEATNWTTAISLTAGIAVFALAMRWDAVDPARETRRADVAFWLHLLAAPLLVHPVFAFLGVFEGQTTGRQAIAVMMLYVAIALISLCIDRRALMASALIYVLYTFSALLNRYGVVSLNYAIAGLVIGSALLLLSAFWHPSRSLVLRLFPAALQRRLAPLR